MKPEKYSPPYFYSGLYEEEQLKNDLRLDGSSISDGKRAFICSQYNTGIVVEKNSFNFVDTGILNPSSNWSISDNILEPNKEKILQLLNLKERLS